MLRAITSEMMLVLMACVALAALLAVTKSKLSGSAKAAVLVAAVLSIAAMLATDAKFWA